MKCIFADAASKKMLISLDFSRFLFLVYVLNILIKYSTDDEAFNKINEKLFHKFNKLLEILNYIM